MSIHRRCFLIAGLIAWIGLWATLPAEAGKGTRASGSRSVSSGQHASANRSSSASRSTSTSRSTNVSRSTSVNVSRDVDIDVDRGCCGCCYNDHPVARAAAVTTAVAVTAAAIGSIVHSVPPSCVPVVVNGFTYQQCGSTWYQPQMSGSSTTYVVVNPPH